MYVWTSLDTHMPIVLRTCHLHRCQFFYPIHTEDWKFVVDFRSSTGMPKMIKHTQKCIYTYTYVHIRVIRILED